jgi:CsoR family transcriptional regulator, copper-sensing transcriptional repressor
MSYNNKKEDVVNRLKRIEGQIKGIKNMVEEDKYCTDILVQIAAARAALNKVSGIILEGHVKGCVKQAAIHDNDQVINELIDTMLKFIK